MTQNKTKLQGTAAKSTDDLNPNVHGRLPERIRPSICAFGGLADGFLPFETKNGSQVELKLASVVMKAVQARSPGIKTCMPCAGKLGDDADHSKAQASDLTWDYQLCCRRARRFSQSKSSYANSCNVELL